MEQGPTQRPWVKGMSSQRKEHGATDRRGGFRKRPPPGSMSGLSDVTEPVGLGGFRQIQGGRRHQNIESEVGKW